MKRFSGFALVLALVFCTVISQRTWAYDSFDDEEDGGRRGGTIFHKHLVSMDVWTGYTYMNMDMVNKMGHDVYDANDYPGINDSINEIHGGVNTQVDLNFELVRGLKFGPRVGFIYAFPGTVEASDVYGGNVKWQVDGYIIPVSVGISYSVPPLKRFRFTFGTDLGAAFGMANYSYDETLPYYGYDYHLKESATSSAPYLNFYAAMRLIFTEAFGMDFRVGYHLADLTNWTVSSSSDATQDQVGDQWKYNGDPVVVDFSGVDAQLGFSFYF